MLYVYFPFCHRVLKTHILKSWVLINFHCSCKGILNKASFFSHASAWQWRITMTNKCRATALIQVEMSECLAFTAFEPSVQTFTLSKKQINILVLLWKSFLSCRPPWKKCRNPGHPRCRLWELTFGKTFLSNIWLNHLQHS